MKYYIVNLWERRGCKLIVSRWLTDSGSLSARWEDAERHRNFDAANSSMETAREGRRFAMGGVISVEVES
jgi:hypothetical protein